MHRRRCPKHVEVLKTARKSAHLRGRTTNEDTEWGLLGEVRGPVGQGPKQRHEYDHECAEQQPGHDVAGIVRPDVDPREAEEESEDDVDDAEHQQGVPVRVPS